MNVRVLRICRVLLNQILQHLHKVLEKVDVDQMGEFGNSGECGGKKDRRRRALQYPEVQSKQQFQCLRLLQKRTELDERRRFH